MSEVKCADMVCPFLLLFWSEIVDAMIVQGWGRSLETSVILL
jgi:hypothetical protein